MALDGAENRKPLLIALFVFAGCFLFCGMGAFILSRQIGDFGRTMTSRTRSNLPPMAGFGSPQKLRTTKDGWFVYRFNELGLEMETVEPPRPGYVIYPNGITRFIDWSLYYTQGSEVGGDLFGFNFRLGTGHSAANLYDHYAKQSNILTKAKSIKIDGKDCLMGEVKRKRPVTAKYGNVIDGVVILQGGDQERVFRYSLYERPGSREELQRILSSIRFVK